MKVRNTFMIFIVSGFWHGANWTFIVWGALNALYFMPLLLTNKNRSNLEIVAQGKMLPSLKECAAMLATFGLTLFAWIFFRAENMAHALQYVRSMFTGLFQWHYYVQTLKFLYSVVGYAMPVLLVGFIITEWLGREQQYAIAKVGFRWNRPFRWALYSLLIFVIGLFMSTSESPFIYFQF